jgi:hypothetical protein
MVPYLVKQESVTIATLKVGQSRQLKSQRDNRTQPNSTNSPHISGAGSLEHNKELDPEMGAGSKVFALMAVVALGITNGKDTAKCLLSSSVD